jgi:hypothetical protein
MAGPDYPKKRDAGPGTVLPDAQGNKHHGEPNRIVGC